MLLLGESPKFDVAAWPWWTLWAGGVLATPIVFVPTVAIAKIGAGSEARAVNVSS